MTLLNGYTPCLAAPVHSVRALILDWAGTTVDFGSLAPVRTLQKVFEEFGVIITEEEARQDMGLAKRDHIASLLRSPRIAAEWTRLQGRAAGNDQVDELYGLFVPLQLQTIAEFSMPVPGVADAVARARRRGVKIGSTTGYNRAILNVLLKESARRGYRPDCSASPEDAGAGRPQPFMIFHLMRQLGVYPPAAIVKVGDTVADIEEGLNAGVWSVGISGTGNMIGLSPADFDALTAHERVRRVAAARDQLAAAGAHYVIESLATIDMVLDDIELRLCQKSN